MAKLITERTAAICILFILGTVLLFHLAILTGLIPYHMVWGGRLNSHQQMVRFELISITANSIMAALAAIRGGIINLPIPAALLRVVFLLMALLFLLNTVGNLFSTNKWETIIFTPLTLLLSVLCLRLGLAPKPEQPILR